MPLILTGEEANRMRVYLDEWAATHHKYRSLSDWIAGLSSWGKEVQVYICTAWLFECTKAWTEFEEPVDWMKPLFAVESSPPIGDLLELAKRWFDLTERQCAEESARSILEIMEPVLERLEFNLSESSPGSNVVVGLRKKAFLGLEVGLKFCSVLSWTVEFEAVQYPTIDQQERDARADAGPVPESVLCILAQTHALGLDPVEAGACLIEHLLAALD